MANYVSSYCLQCGHTPSVSIRILKFSIYIQQYYEPFRLVFLELARNSQEYINSMIHHWCGVGTYMHCGWILTCMDPQMAPEIHVNSTDAFALWIPSAIAKHNNIIIARYAGAMEIK